MEKLHWGNLWLLPDSWTDCDEILRTSRGDQEVSVLTNEMRRRDVVVCSWRRVLDETIVVNHENELCKITTTTSHTHPVSLFSHSSHPATPSPVLFLYAKRDLSSLVFVNGFCVRAGAANPASVYSEQNIKAIRTRTRAAINWLASESRMNVKDW